MTVNVGGKMVKKSEKEVAEEKKEEVKINPFDVVVQRGTNHAWVNNGSDPALLIGVLIDSELAD